MARVIGFKIETDSRSLIGAKRAIIGTETELKKLRKATKGNIGAQKAAAAQTIKLETRLKGLRTQYTQAQRAALGLGKSLTLQQSINKGLTSSFKTLGTTLAGVFAARAIIQGIGNTINIFKDFEQAQADLASVLGKSRNEIQALTEDAKRLGAATVFTASQVSELQKEFAKLVFS